ncbi:hypothetical protein HHL22_20510 [Hymenobacter sp. RP-2-7]|uniref:Uncharacterized protein n=1 Tax=Hymenobacter polaris TaxID=2682546 RepID=A0A7Y0FPI5_9BACT|nr:hypothetical protein [Hymenobacter polaris]NML67590.1 hypothetical protein [Hymenobacter polaris]
MMDFRDIALGLLAIIGVLAVLVWHLYYRLGQLKARVDPSPAQAARAYLAPEPTPAELDSASPAPCTPWGRVRQVLRRWNWVYLGAGALYGFVALFNWLVTSAAERAARKAAAAGSSLSEIAKEAAGAAAAESAKVVDPSLVLLKLAVAVVVFCLIMGLGWGALNAAMPVVPDWAKGDYSDPARAAAVGLETPVAGFKRSFLRQGDLDRVKLLLGFFGLFVLAAGISVWAGFSVQ